MDENKEIKKVGHDVEEFNQEPEIVPFKGDFMESTVEVANQLAAYEKAIDTIINFMIRRTYPGDWVSHGRKGDALEDRIVNPTGAAAERIARDLGVQESNRTEPTKEMNPNFPGHYSYKCEGDFSFRGRTVHAIGIASTKNPFHYKSQGYEKKPEDIREEYLVQEAWRDCVKQGIKALFGLRKIPLMKLKELGYDISKVKMVNFDESSTSASRVDKEKVEKKSLGVTVVFTGIHGKKWSGKEFWELTDSKGVVYTLWRPGTHDDTMRIRQAIERKESLDITFDYDGRYRTIVTFKEAQAH